MSNIAVRHTPTRYGDARAWVYADQSEQRGRASITLDMVLFTAAVQYPRGYLPSGIVLARAESGLYGPYDDSATDGRDLAAGFLWTAFTPSADREAAPLWVGVGLIQEDRLPPGHGLDESAKADLASWFKFF